MAIVGLNLPTDIPWERMCVNLDMMALAACELHHPPKWQSSIAVSQYVPQDEYQIYNGRQITYLKVTCTITGFQPRDKEVEGTINFGGIGVQTIDNIDSLLDSYLPCTGALIQVAVSPHTKFSGAPGATLDKYPYFMDFQPKKRELYEMVTETGERSSRSLEALKIGKASGNSESLEVLDIDQGGSSGGSANVSYAGVGVGGSYNESTQGQWGTKQLANQEQSITRSTDESRERRESESHTTQLSQMYHLLDSYHQGTNRALFFVQPRPHILEVPTGFVRGPRGVEGIQEFFLVVNEPKDLGGFVVSVRLDTSHLTVIPTMDYDRSRTDTVYCKASANVPTENDIPDGPDSQGIYHDGDRIGSLVYNCYKKDDIQSTPYTPPSGYKIDVNNNGGYVDQVNTSPHGSSTVDVDPNGQFLTVTCQATSHVCKYDDNASHWFPYDAPQNYSQDYRKWPASAERDIVVNLVSTEPIVHTGDTQALLITTRELCCGETSRKVRGSVADVIMLAGRDGKGVRASVSQFAGVSMDANLTSTRESDVSGRNLSGVTSTMPSSVQPTRAGAACDQSSGVPPCDPQSMTRATPQQAAVPVSGAAGMTAREANELSGTIREAMIRSAGSRKRDGAEPVAYIDTDLFHLQLQRQYLQSEPGRAILSRPIKDLIDEKIARRLAGHYKLPVNEITCNQLSNVPAAILAKAADIKLDEARRIKLTLLGIPLHDSPPGGHAPASAEKPPSADE